MTAFMPHDEGVEVSVAAKREHAAAGRPLEGDMRATGPRQGAGERGMIEMQARVKLGDGFPCIVRRADAVAVLFQMLRGPF